MQGSFRVETDSLGQTNLDRDSIWGIHTKRAIENFPVSGILLSSFPAVIVAIAWVKIAAARANASLGVLSREKKEAIEHACSQLASGQHHDAFPVDMFQGGAGTSTNMNANEVIANLGLRVMGFAPGEYDHLHPNDDVNKSQSTNDVYPTAIRIAMVSQCALLQVALTQLRDAFAERAVAFEAVPKIGRTQLQDAVPMTLGQEFGAFAATVNEDILLLSRTSKLLLEVNLGGTAIGTGINAPAGYTDLALTELAKVSGLKLQLSSNLMEASWDTGAYVTLSGALKRTGIKLSKICNDLRLLASGPRCGLGEIQLPPVQAGSSIMPGKVNPVIPEMVNQVAFQVAGNDLTVTMAAESGQLQLNAFEPVILLNILQSIGLLKRGAELLARKCVAGITANANRTQYVLEGSLAVATALVPHIGYENAAAIAKTALTNGTSITDAAVALGFGPSSEIEHILKIKESQSPNTKGTPHGSARNENY